MDLTEPVLDPAALPSRFVIRIGSLQAALHGRINRPSALAASHSAGPAISDVAGGALVTVLEATIVVEPVR